LGTFLIDFVSHNWPVPVGAVIIATCGTVVMRRRGLPGLLLVGAATLMGLVIANHLLLKRFLRQHPTWSASSSEAWSDSAWGALILAFVLTLVALIGRRAWPLPVQIVAALLLALVIPPFTAAGLLVVGCYLFGSCL
jgi:hypothetical protein